MTTSEAATRTRLDPPVVATQLSRLVDQGVVERVPLPDGSRVGFQVAERFFNIWYLMRASRRVRRRLMWLVKFMEALYQKEEMGEKASKYLHDGPTAQGGSRWADLAFALACTVRGRALSHALTCAGLDTLQHFDESHADIWHLLGDILQNEKDRSDEAVAALEKAVTLEPKVTDHRMCLGFALGKAGRHADAEKTFREVTEAEPENDRAWGGLADALWRLDRDDCVAAYRRAGELGDKDAWPRLAMYLVHHTPSQADEAEALARQAVAEAPDDACGWCALASILEKRNAPLEEQEHAWRTALQKRPDHDILAKGLADTLLRANRGLPEAEDLARRALAAHPEDLQDRILVARILLARGDWTSTVLTLDPLLQDESTSPSSPHWDGVMDFFRDTVVRGRASEAVEAMDQTGAGERWRPLREALRCVAFGNSSHLLAVAPEVRKPATLILDKLWPESERPEPKAKKKTPRKKRLRV